MLGVVWRAGGIGTHSRSRTVQTEARREHSQTDPGGKGNPSFSCATVRLAIFVAAASQPSQRHHECGRLSRERQRRLLGAVLLNRAGVCGSTSGVRFGGATPRSAAAVCNLEMRGVCLALEKGCFRRAGAANGASGATSVTDG